MKTPNRMSTLITKTKPIESYRKDPVQLYTIIRGNINRLEQENALDTEFWRTMTMVDHFYYNYECSDFRILSVQLKDVELMIEMRGYSIACVVQLLQEWNIFRDNQTPDLRYYMFEYFHLIPNGNHNTGYHEKALYNDIYVSFYGLRLISDMIHEQCNGGNMKLLLDELYKKDIKPGKKDEFYFIENKAFGRSRLRHI